MNPASQDIANFLAAETPLSLTLATNLFYARMPDQSDFCVTVLDNPGDSPMLTFDKATSNYFFSSVSVQVREVDYAAGWTAMFNILTYLHGLSQTNSIDGTAYYSVIKAMNDPQVLHWDHKGRVIFFVNFEVQRKPI